MGDGIAVIRGDVVQMGNLPTRPPQLKLSLSLWATCEVASPMAVGMPYFVRMLYGGVLILSYNKFHHVKVVGTCEDWQSHSGNDMFDTVFSIHGGKDRCNQ